MRSLADSLDASSSCDLRARVTGAHFTCFAGTKVQMLTQKALQARCHLSLCPLSRQCFRQGTQFTRVASTSVQKLTQRRCAAREALPALASQDACDDAMICGDEMICDDELRVDDDEMRVCQEGYEPEALAGLLAPAAVGKRPLLRRALRDL